MAKEWRTRLWAEGCTHFGFMSHFVRASRFAGKGKPFLRIRILLDERERSLEGLIGGCIVNHPIKAACPWKGEHEPRGPKVDLGVYRCNHSNAPSTTQSIKCNIQTALYDIVCLFDRLPVLFPAKHEERRGRPPGQEHRAKAKVRIHDPDHDARGWDVAVGFILLGQASFFQ